MTILAIETSCDDTAAAVVRDGAVLSNIISSQDIHDHYGGIVPELASREHVKGIAPIVHAAMQEAKVDIDAVDAIAVTYGPGLAGSLLVGCHFAKGLAMRHAKPLYPIHHIEAHLYSGYLEDPTLPYPSICLVVSGGHTSIFHVTGPTSYSVMGSTKDDAAGEAFDKIAKLVGLGYPGGPHVDRLARTGNSAAFDLPRGLIHEPTYDFSFSGLKTAVRREVEKMRSKGTELPIEDLCASAQTAIVDVLVSKTMRAADDLKVNAVVIAGGVSANSELRSRMSAAAEQRGIAFVAPRLGYCVDNAAMIAFVAQMRIKSGMTEGLGEQIPSFSIEPRPMRSR
ncbi:MAG: tRNA (adenosine(37)-N6)-threonylcarbamoyltransferase complex transferase subunit TsaD [Ignavibacteria bacterium]|nr:tRNA (adenosine(37)-N6)-threonylcarbamoyltransferase complex transferase subunit TsaD [Ignavibacteria bacterium]MBP6510184.1 tRNA (adenosine(37)-N6)-threonylcarbamoyltransferase complex transferase subunit TsaD [Candidatus Kapabacteria bacterium]MBK6417855.1 tRNA (adenosine(37)-N6)-threonylcarbamoyltransferase complex transferase subunit TsaD [Ignavibacteria bacterium]MBK6760883.1 tRNA (adenosine(37)-N6)-threonylcarbamoyltransferase complex transferase subunit TsaD [Ignavibacteria bacterium]